MIQYSFPPEPSNILYVVIICPVAIHDVIDASHVKCGKGTCAQLTILAVLSKHSSPKHDKQLRIVYKGCSVMLIRAGTVSFLLLSVAF